ncbi:MAG TPA: peptidoglycan recognition family protein [Anditalea sp.]|nr:peptidoglycan recognition family protein [Anditalea sp.]
MLKWLLYILILGASSCAGKPTFRTFDKLIDYGEEREELTLQYIRDRHGIETESIEITPRMVVLHWTVVPTIEQTFYVFDPHMLAGARPDLQTASALNVSSQFLVDRDGTIFRLMPENHFARHVIGLNHLAIGIENIGSDSNPLTKAQLKANEEIIRYLKGKYDITHVIGHYEYIEFQGHPYWKETDASYLTEKTDPGERFMRWIRKRIRDLEIEGVP